MSSSFRRISGTGRLISGFVSDRSLTGAGLTGEGSDDSRTARVRRWSSPLTGSLRRPLSTERAGGGGGAGLRGFATGFGSRAGEAGGGSAFLRASAARSSSAAFFACACFIASSRLAASAASLSAFAFSLAASASSLAFAASARAFSFAASASALACSAAARAFSFASISSRPFSCSCLAATLRMVSSSALWMLLV